jgi:hypothetical protein
LKIAQGQEAKKQDVSGEDTTWEGAAGFGERQAFTLGLMTAAAFIPVSKARRFRQRPFKLSSPMPPVA